MGPTTAPGTLPDRVALVAPAASSVQHAISDTTKNRKCSRQAKFERPPKPSISRLEASCNERPFRVDQFVADAQSKSQDDTVLYLAYGSNLQAAKFRGDRGIKPLAQINVVVPSLKMTFDLPGIPYKEPCFANTARRESKHEALNGADSLNEKTSLLGKRPSERYRKDDWKKGLVGVVYEVTPKDYAHIIATEGGGAGYQDILVECHPFESSDPNVPVPESPSLPPFKAHTLFAPRLPDGEEPPKRGGHIQRPDPGYAQASARYLNIITDGAAECELPYEYQDYLQSIRPYTITTWKQRVGQAMLLSFWGPIVLAVFGFGRLFTDKKGRVPGWVAQLTNAVFKAVWTSYDSFFRPAFGDGERTIEDNDEDDKADERRLPLYGCDIEKE